MPQFLKDLLAVFRAPSANDLAQRQLQDAEREILKHQDAAEFHDAMVSYLTTKIERLQEHATINGADLFSPTFGLNIVTADNFDGIRKAA